MCNAVCKLALALAVAAMVTGCSKKDEAKEEATNLVEIITNLMDAGNYEGALAMMDTIDAKYADQVEQRQQIMAMRPRAIEQATLQQIVAADSLRLSLELQLEEMNSLMKHIDGNGLEGYYVVADAYNPNFINSTGIDPRVNDSSFVYYIVANSQGKVIGINQLQLSTGDEQCVSDAIPAGSARVSAIEGSEIASFLTEEVQALGQWAWDNRDRVNGAAILGSKGTQKVKLTPKQAAAFGTAWQYANLRQQHRSAQMLREKLERRLQIARDQIANTQAPPAP